MYCHILAIYYFDARAKKICFFLVKKVSKKKGKERFRETGDPFFNSLVVSRFVNQSTVVLCIRDGLSVNVPEPLPQS